MPPVNFRVIDISDGTLSFAWDKPRFDGGLPILAYLIELNLSGTGTWNPYKVSGSQNTVRITDLEIGKHYFSRIFSENEIGVSSRPTELKESICAKLPTSTLLHDFIFI